MSNPRSAALLAAATAATASAALGAACAPAQSIPYTARPHGRVVTHDRGEAHVRRLTMAVTSSEQRLHATVALTVANESARAIRRELRIGRCTGGVPAAPVCPSDKTVPVRLAAGASRTYVTRATLRRPPAVPDAIQAALVRPGARKTNDAYRSDGLLLLTGRAWRGSGAGRVYGVRLGPADGARRLDFDVPLLARDVAYVDAEWHGAAAPKALPTALSSCTGATCTSTALAAGRMRSRPGMFRNRFPLHREQADALGLTVGAVGQPPLLEAMLPWPEPLAGESTRSRVAPARAHISRSGAHA